MLYLKKVSIISIPKIYVLVNKKSDELNSRNHRQKKVPRFVTLSEKNATSSNLEGSSHEKEISRDNYRK